VAQPDNPDRMLAKIRALLTKAEDPAATPAEAEAFTAKAAELMAKYGVDRAMLAAADPTSDVPGDRIIWIQAPYALDKQRLLSQLGLALGCKTVLKQSVRGYAVHLFGYASDLERVDMLFTSLLLQAVNSLAQTPVPYWENAAAFRRSWLAGFAAMIAHRLHQAEKRAAANATQEREQAGTGGPSVALVLADRATVVQRKLEEAYPKLGKARARKLSGSGYRDGVEAGRRADLGGTRVGGRARGALGGAR
jgi:hypothetical protein